MQIPTNHNARQGYWYDIEHYHPRQRTKGSNKTLATPPKCLADLCGERAIGGTYLAAELLGDAER